MIWIVYIWTLVRWQCGSHTWCLLLAYYKYCLLLLLDLILLLSPCSHSPFGWHKDCNFEPASYFCHNAGNSAVKECSSQFFLTLNQLLCLHQMDFHLWNCREGHWIKVHSFIPPQSISLDGNHVGVVSLCQYHFSVELGQTCKTWRVLATTFRDCLDSDE